MVKKQGNTIKKAGTNLQPIEPSVTLKYQNTDDEEDENDNEEDYKPIKIGFLDRIRANFYNDKLISILKEFKSVSDSITDSDFEKDYKLYSYMMTVVENHITKDKMYEIINKFDIDGTSIPSQYKSYSEGINNRLDDLLKIDKKFMKLLKIMNKIYELGFNTYKSLSNESIITILIDTLGCKIYDFILLLKDNHYFHKNKLGYTLTGDTQSIYHYKKHAKFYWLLRNHPKLPLTEECKRNIQIAYPKQYQYCASSQMIDPIKYCSESNLRKTGGRRKLKSYK